MSSRLWFFFFSISSPISTRKSYNSSMRIEASIASLRLKQSEALWPMSWWNAWYLAMFLFDIFLEPLWSLIKFFILDEAKDFFNMSIERVVFSNLIAKDLVGPASKPLFFEGRVSSDQHFLSSSCHRLGCSTFRVAYLASSALIYFFYPFLGKSLQSRGPIFLSDHYNSDFAQTPKVIQSLKFSFRSSTWSSCLE